MPGIPRVRDPYRELRTMKSLFISSLFVMCSVVCMAQTQRPTQQPSTPPVNPSPSGSATQTGPTARKQGWSYDPDAGMVFQHGDFKWTSWGYGEHVFRPEGNGFWRRVRQGMEFDLPRFTPHYRSAVVYEVDFTDTNFFRDRSKLNIVENLFVTIQDAEDPGKLRFIFGENLHILSREDGLSSGNLPTINRSLILEEHGSVRTFGTQFGLQFMKALSPRYVIAISTQDNRGSLNTTNPRYVVGNDVAAKGTALFLNSPKDHRSLLLGAAIDHTRDIRNGTWTFISAVAGQGVGTAPASGNKLTAEGDITFTARAGNHPYTVESEHIYSNFSKARTNVAGGYGQAQFSLFDTIRAGDLDPFVRYDWVRFSSNQLAPPIFQRALRTGINWNLPYTHKFANFHLEYARNSIVGPALLIPSTKAFNELGLELRFSAIRYVRH